MSVALGTWTVSNTNTAAITIPADTGDRVVDVAVTMEVRGTPFDTFPVTCGGVPMIEATGSPSESPNGVARVRRFYLLNDDLPAVGAQNVVASPTGGADISYVLAAAVHTGVNQAAPTYIENADDLIDALRIPSGTDTWSYTDGAAATCALVNGNDGTTFTWPGPWTERWDANDGSNEARSTGGDRTYTGTGTDSVTVTGSGAGRTAGAVLLWDAVQAATGPTINTQPANLSVPVGDTATLHADVTGTGTVTYQWQFSTGGAFANVTDGVGGTAADYTTRRLAAGDTGIQYQFIATDDNGPVTSDPATITVTAVSVPRIKVEFRGA